MRIPLKTTEVQYDESGNVIPPENADWNRKIQTYRTGSGTTATETSDSSEEDHSGETSSTKYIGNTNTNKFHYSTCQEVSKILEEHKVFSKTTEVQYDESGNVIPPENADWNRKIQTYRTGSGITATETSGSDEEAADNTEGAGGEN